jgi:hypothetical protein
MAEKKRERVSQCTGWDSFTPNADTVDHVTCKVCGTKCDVKRNVVGPRSSAAAMAVAAGQDANAVYDHFFCSNSGYPWHDQALVLLLKARDTPSAVEEKALREEATKIILSKAATKEVHYLP